MAISNDWLNINPSSGNGDAQPLVTILNVNFSRTNNRSVTIVGATAHGQRAQATITQSAKGPYVEIDCIEDEDGHDIVDYQPQSTVPRTRANYKVIGYSNFPAISIEETTNDFTNLNDLDRPVSFILTDASSQNHLEQLDGDLSVDYGATDRYMFTITFMLKQNDNQNARTITIKVLNSNQGRVTQDTITFYQEGNNQSENS